MHYTVYKITNKLNNKEYIGKHQTSNINDGYMGSGKALKRAIIKHGTGNFEKQILFVFDNAEEMNAKEAELVTESYCRLDTNYNLKPGGSGGFALVDQTKGSLAGAAKRKQLLNEDAIFKQKSIEHAKSGYAASLALISTEERSRRRSLMNADLKHSNEVRAKISAARKGKDIGNQRRAIPVRCGKMEFASYKLAAEYFNVSEQTIGYRVKTGKYQIGR